MPTPFIQPVFLLGLKSSSCSCHKFSPFPLFQLYPHRVQGGFSLLICRSVVTLNFTNCRSSEDSGENYLNSHPVLLTSVFWWFRTVSNSLIGIMPNNNGLSSIIAWLCHGDELMPWVKQRGILLLICLNSVLALPIIESYSWWITVHCFVVRRGFRPVINN